MQSVLAPAVRVVREEALIARRTRRRRLGATLAHPTDEVGQVHKEQGLLISGRSSASSARVDERLRIREEAQFFGPRGRRLFGISHAPLDDPIGGVLVCSPIKLEAMKNYRREVLLSRELARLGYEVLRFHYAGTGHSDSDGSTTTFRSLVDDARRALDVLHARSRGRPIAAVGTRIAATVAAAATLDGAGIPLVMWQPVADPSVYLREVLRAPLIAGLKHVPGDDGSPTRDPLAEIRHTGFTDVLGFALEASLYHSMLDVALEQAIGGTPRAILVIDVNRRNEPRSDYQALGDRLMKRGFSVEMTVIRHADVGWWFPDLGSHPHALDDRLVSVTSGWLHRVALKGAYR